MEATKLDGGFPDVCFACKNMVGYMRCKITDERPPKKEEVWDYEKDECNFFDPKED